MMEEIYKNGPIVIAFDAAPDLYYYSEGIFNGGGKKPKREKNSPLIGDWVKTNHAVVCMGWGEERGVKFWILKNSWGEKWGEKGYFRMIRGINLAGVENQAVFLEAEDDETKLLG